MQRTRPLQTLFRNIMILVALVYLAAMYYVWQINLRDTETRLSNLNSITLQGVRTTLKGHELLLQGFGSELIAHGVLDNPEAGRELIERMKSIDPGMVGFGLARPDGQLVLVSGFKPGQDLPNLAEQGESRDSFNQVIDSNRLRTGRPYFFKALESWVIPIRTPIYDSNDQLIAVMTAGYKIDSANVTWNNTEIPPDTAIAIVRDDGYLISLRPMPEGPREKIMQMMYGEQIADSVLATINSLDNQKTFLPIHTPRSPQEKNRNRYIAYNYIPEYRLHIGAMMTRGRVFNNWLQRLYVPSLLFLIFLVGGSWAFRRALQRQNFADSEIRQLSAWQNAVLDGADYSIISTNTDGTIVSFNNAAEEMLGYTESEVAGKATPELFHDPDEIEQQARKLSAELGQTVKPDFEAFVAKARLYEPEDREWTYIRKDGSRIPVYLSITALHDDQNEIIGFLGIAADLSEKKEIQASLRSSEAQYRTLFDHAGDAIFLMQGDHFVDCNPATLAMFACKRNEIVGSTPQRYSPELQPDGRASNEKALEKINAAFAGTPQRFEWRHIKYDGTPFDAEVSLTSVEISGIAHLLATVRDITARKRSEQAVRSIATAVTSQSGKDFFQQMVKNLNELFAAKYAFIGLLDEEDPRKINTLAVSIDGDIVENMSYPLDDTPCDNVVGHATCAYPDHVQEKFPKDKLLQEMGVESYIGTPLFNANNDPLGIIVVLDTAAMTELNQLQSILEIFAARAGAELDRLESEQKHQKLQHQLQQAQKMESLGQLTGGIAHDFNNMLASILGYTDLAKDLEADKKPEKLKSYLDQVYSAGERARDLIAQMLTFSRASEISEKHPLSISPIVKEATKMLRPMLPSSIDMHVHINENLPDINADPVQLNQLIMNLCINARDAMEGKGKLDIEVSSTNHSDSLCSSCQKTFSGDFIEISVRDNGSGISPEIIKSLFEPFFTTKEIGKGTGMGLAMTHGIVHDHSGHIIVDSQPGVGTEFRILLPYLKNGAKNTVRKQESQKNTFSGNGQHILVIDDEEPIAGFMKELLELNNYRVDIFTDSTLALKAFNQHSNHYDLVITDQTMPHMTGEELARTLIEANPGIPIILCTGHSTHINKESAKEIGIKSYLIKPVATADMLETVYGLLNQ